MKSSASKIKMTSFDDLFGSTDETVCSVDTAKTIQDIEISKLSTFANHPFKVLDDQKMEETKESIAKYGVLVPIIARPKEDGTFEIIAGHRRKRACELLKLPTIPTIVRDLDDEESTIVMVDSNIQRENLLFSEKAYAYKMKLEAIKKQGKRTDLTSAQVVPKLTAREQVAKDAGVNRMEITRYIRLTELITDLLNMTDERKIAFNTAVELSYLSHDEQAMLLKKIKDLAVIPSMAQATKLKKYSAEGSLNEAVADAILSETSEKLTRYFPKSYSKEQMEDIITDLLQKWHDEQN
ncbi:MAG: ParB/RepB/Spo0J family partition protein [Epulopiscium sp.]|nr:ParB/RepB/Spo0J family partition protein [Candidatus Epulonipiscium sp.]